MTWECSRCDWKGQRAGLREENGVPLCPMSGVADCYGFGPSDYRLYISYTKAGPNALQVIKRDSAGQYVTYYGKGCRPNQWGFCG